MRKICTVYIAFKGYIQSPMFNLKCHECIKRSEITRGDSSVFLTLPQADTHYQFGLNGLKKKKNEKLGGSAVTHWSVLAVIVKFLSLPV